MTAPAGYVATHPKFEPKVLQAKEHVRALFLAITTSNLSDERVQELKNNYSEARRIIEELAEVEE